MLVVLLFFLFFIRSISANLLISSAFASASFFICDASNRAFSSIILACSSSFF